MDSIKKEKLNLLMEMYLDQKTMREEDTLLLLQVLSESAALRAQLNLAAAGLKNMKQKRRRGCQMDKRDCKLTVVNNKRVN